jgi:serine/threonine-protein kinase ATR
VIVTELDSVSDPSVLQTQPFGIVLPSPASIAEFWPESQQFVALPHELQRTISSHVGAIYIGLTLLLCLANGVRQQQGRSAGSATFDHHQPFILDTCTALWQHFRRWTTGSEKQSFYDETVNVFLEVLEAVAVPVVLSKGQPPGSSKAAHTLVQGVSSLLEKVNVSPVTQLQLASLLIRLRNIVDGTNEPHSKSDCQRPTSPSIVLMDLESGVGKLCRDAEKFLDLQKDLQVRALSSLLCVKLMRFS